MSWLGNVGGRLYRGEVSVDFVGRKKLWYSISGLILVICLAALLIRGLAYSVEFKGGSVFQFTAPAATSSQVTSVVAHAGSSQDVIVQVVHGAGQASWQVQTPKLAYSQAVKIQGALAQAFHPPQGKVSFTFVGPSWGSQISKKALEALIAFLIVIVAYLSIAFEWKMASAALVALLHDIVITIGVYALVGFRVSPATVIGLLTILGYSLYDTVVVFDKVRENTAGLLGTRRASYSQAANLALNQTLVRSINTSLIALMPVAAILVVAVTLLGSGELKDLSLVLFIGMLSGTYSSICIATPVLADLKEREPQYKQLARAVALRAAGGRSRAKAKVGGGSDGDDAVNGGSADAVASGEAPSDSPTGERVPAGRTASTSSAPRTPRPGGPRQQPRRPGAAKRRPGGKKKRR